MGAFPLLLNHGVRAVCSLENMCSLDTVNWFFQAQFELCCFIHLAKRGNNIHILFGQRDHIT